MVFLFLLWYASMQSASVTYCSSFEFVRCLVCSCNNLSACRFLSRRLLLCFPFFFFNDTATTEIYTLSLHDALPFSRDYQHRGLARHARARDHRRRQLSVVGRAGRGRGRPGAAACQRFGGGAAIHDRQRRRSGDRKSTRLNSSHSQISDAVFCLKQKTLSVIFLALSELVTSRHAAPSAFAQQSNSLRGFETGRELSASSRLMGF